MLNRRILRSSPASLHSPPPQKNSCVFSTKVLKLLILLLVFFCLRSLPFFCLTLSRSHDSCHHSSAGLRSAFQAVQAHRFIRFCSGSLSEICFLMRSCYTVGQECTRSKSKTIKQLRNSLWNVLFLLFDINNQSPTLTVFFFFCKLTLLIMVMQFWPKIKSLCRFLRHICCRAAGVH